MHEQKAICTITTGNVKASAEAYYSSKPDLDDLRNQEDPATFSKQLYLFLRQMEERLVKEIQKIQISLESLELQSSTSKGNRTKCFCDKNINNLENEITNLTNNNLFNNNNTNTSNSTNLNEQFLNIFRYSWKMENFTEHLNKRTFEHSIYSPTFSIRGNLLLFKILII